MRVAAFMLVLVCLVPALVPVAGAQRKKDERSPYDPAWAAVKPLRTVQHAYNAKQTPEQNGAALKTALVALKAGDCLVIEAGTYSLAGGMFELNVAGTEKAPVWVTAAESKGEPARVVITRPDARQNVLNVGGAAPARFLCLRGLEITGGSHGLRLHDCEDVWVDRCRFYDTGEVAISANTRDTARLFLTRNDISRTSGTGEGMYLGANDGKVKMRDSVIALNHIHDIGGDKVTQGDGIEVKQGSFGNRIAENTVHDTAYPCIIAYGTGGERPNIIERNTCWNSGDNVMQVQGEAVVRNNLLLNGGNAGFASHDHQGKSVNLVVVHNTIVSRKLGAKLNSWSAREGMVFANNAVYSEGAAIQFSGGSQGVDLRGNVVFGSVSGAGAGFVKGRGLEDFAGLTWDAARRDARPAAGSPLVGAADSEPKVETDLAGAKRAGRVAGACEK
ncbi:MAG: right-handed parallel beta-helix repeat-containing protein [Planctomycetes bacterium]|nr:right-handed parallel beta-helix repeat-containing protein [Planctomycetota bacterium]MCL4730670.1 right-handed parallel beta-helix repeat-containing protein [Planctomycetota bacterium]